MERFDVHSLLHCPSIFAFFCVACGKQLLATEAAGDVRLQLANCRRPALNHRGVFFGPGSQLLVDNTIAKIAKRLRIFTVLFEGDE